MDHSQQLQLWQEQFAGIGGTNPLIRFEPSSFGQVDLARAHPGGLAQLVSARSTTIGNLVRDGVALARALSATKRILRKAQRIEQTFGAEALFVAGGLVSIDDKKLPILLWRAHLLVRGDDYELRISELPVLNPAVTELIAQHRPDFKESDLIAVATGQSDLIPVGALALVSQYLQSTEAEIEKLLVLGNFVPDLIRLSQLDLPEDLRSLATLLGDQGKAPVVSESPVTLVAEADTSQRLVLRRAHEGESFAVRTLPGCGYLQTVVNLLANNALDGRRTLVVAPREQTLDELAERLSSHGLGGLAIRANDAWNDVVAAISRNEKATPGVLLEAKAEHRKAQAAIEHYFNAVATSDSVLGISLIEALEELAKLAGGANPPVNAARIKPELLGTIRSTAPELLAQAHEARVFEYGPKSSPWYGARFETQDEIAKALAAVRELAAENWRTLSYQINRYLADLELTPCESVEQWAEQLRLLLGVRYTLDKFLPSIFDRPLHDLIKATAGRSERTELSGAQRRRFKKLAKEFLRPGTSVSNLHQALKDAQEQRELWEKHNKTQAPPTVPLGLAETQAKFETISEVIALLDKHLDPDPDRPLLTRLGFDELGSRFEELATQTEYLDQYLDRKPIVKKLSDAGLGQLSKELSLLNPRSQQVQLEFELAWWQSALEAIVQRNPEILEYDAKHLAELEEAFETSGQKVIAEGGNTVRAALSERWKAGIQKQPASADKLRDQLRKRSITLKEGLMAGGTLWQQLVPAVMVSPYRIWELAASDSFDTVLVLDAASAGAAETIFALTKADQVIAFGDPAIAAPENFDTVARANQDSHESDRPSVYELVESRFGHELISRSYRMNGQVLGRYLNQNFYDDEIILEPTVGQLFGEHNFEHFEVTEGANAESTIEGATESMDSEVEKVVELVISHARWHPDESLMVVTASKSHADRIDQRVSEAVREQPAIAEFFDAHGRERFESVTMSELTHRLADRVIFSVGFGRTPEGRISGTLGDFNSPGAGRWMVNQIVSARKRLSVVSCYNFEDFAGGSLPENQKWLKDLIAPSFLSDVLDGDPDPLLSDLAKRLEKLGLKVNLNFAGRIALVASRGKSAIVIDADWSLAGESWEEKLRLRPGLLRAMGWQYTRVHAFEIFAQPQEVANRIAMKLGLDLNGRVEPLFDELASEDQPEGWGDGDDSNDDRLRDDKPPHWG